MEFSDDAESVEDIFTPATKTGLGGLFQDKNRERHNLKYEAPKKNAEESKYKEAQTTIKKCCLVGVFLHI